jgi:uncharacterized membrane protein
MTRLIIIAAVLAISATADARPYYGGGHHTSSHGGSYSGSYGGSSHRGGHYRNPRTANHYGRHR